MIPKGAVLLRDNKGLQPADSPVMVLRKTAATPEVLDVIDAVSAEITTTAYRKMCLEVSVNHHDPADVAATFLAAQQPAVARPRANLRQLTAYRPGS